MVWVPKDSTDDCSGLSDSHTVSGPQDGSYLYKIADKFSTKFEEKYAKIRLEGKGCTLHET
jgi:hypothetical protein